MTELLSSLPPFNTIAIILVGAWLAYKEFSSGTSSLKNTIIDDQKTRIAQLIDERDRCEETAIEADKKVAARDATVIEKDIQIKDLKEQVAFRNPDLTDLIKQGFNINKKVIEFMEMNIKMMDKINEKMDYQTKILEKGENRSQKIDKASATHDGEIMRTPVKKEDVIK